jgi:hypothetical protein
VKIRIYGNNQNKHNKNIIKVFNQHITALDKNTNNNNKITPKCRKIATKSNLIIKIIKYPIPISQPSLGFKSVKF